MDFWHGMTSSGSLYALMDIGSAPHKTQVNVNGAASVFDNHGDVQQ
jgi:hypothetical protein